MEHTLIDKAREFAEKAHQGQYRKWVMDGLGQQIPYFTHPCRVADVVSKRPDVTTEMIAAAYLHDVIEDCGVQPFNLTIQFGKTVTDLVVELTNEKHDGKPYEKAPREIRKAYDRLRLSKVSKQAKIIKMLDRIDNLNEMADASPSFRRKYAFESMALCSVVGDADTSLEWQILGISIYILRTIDAKSTLVDPQTQK